MFSHKRALLLSLIMHILAGLILSYSLGQWVRPKMVYTPPHKAVEISLFPGHHDSSSTERLKEKQKALSESSKQSAPAHPASSLHLRDLKVSTLNSPDQKALSWASAKSIESARKAQGLKSGFSFAGSMSMESEVRHEPFFQALWKKINTTLVYPPELVNNRIDGRVSIEVEVDSFGVFTGRFLALQSDDSILKAYIAALLTHALSTPLPSMTHAEWDKIVLVLRFDFIILGPGETFTDHGHSPQQVKNLLSFRREAFGEPILNKKIEKFFTHTVPPIIPIPGGFYIDFIRAYEYVQNLDKLDPELVQRSHLQVMKERWHQVIKKK